MQLYMLETNTAGYIIIGEVVLVREHLIKVTMACVFSKSAIGEKKKNITRIKLSRYRAKRFRYLARKFSSRAGNHCDQPGKLSIYPGGMPDRALGRGNRG